MLVYGSLLVGGMVLPGYDSSFQPSLTFFQMPWYVGMFISVLNFGFPDGFRNPRRKWSQVSFPKA